MISAIDNSPDGASVSSAQDESGEGRAVSKGAAAKTANEETPASETDCHYRNAPLIMRAVWSPDPLTIMAAAGCQSTDSTGPA